MTSPFPFPTRYHHAVTAPGAVHTVHFYSLTDPVLDVANSVMAGKRWRLPDDLDNPTKYRDYIRNEGNDGWILEGSWGIAPYDLGQVPVADVDGYLWPGDVEGGSGGGPATLDIEDEGVTEGAADTIDFVGAGVDVAFAAGKATVTIGGGAGGWTLTVDEDGTSFANFTSVSGTWSSNGTEIIQTDTAASERHARLTARAPNAVCIWEAEVTIVTGAGADSRVGLVPGYNATLSSVPVILFRGDTTSGTHIESLRQGVGVNDNVALATTYGTFYLLRLVIAGPRVSVYVNGTHYLTTHSQGEQANVAYLGLYSSALTFRTMPFNPIGS